jgi:hypothetical protein
MLRILLPVLALAAGFERTAEASCAGPTEYALPLHGQEDVPPGCVIELVVAADYVDFDPALLVVRRVDGDITVPLEHALESQLSEVIIDTGHTICDTETCEDVETEGFSFPIDRHRLLVSGGLPPDSAIEVVTDEGSLLASFTTAIDDGSATGTCSVPDAFELAPPHCDESCRVSSECSEDSDGDGVPDREEDDSGCAIAGAGGTAPALLLLLGALSLRRPRDPRRRAGATPRAST